MEAGARTDRLRSLTISPATFAWFAYVALAALFLIVVSGATVRLTGSGLGCENWPRCGETLLPPKDYNAYVEFGNRVMGFAVGITTLIAAGAAFRVPGLPRWLLWSAVVLPFTVLAQGILGGITVVFELHPLIVMGHFLLSLVALAVALVVVQGARNFARGATAESPLGSAWLALALVPAALALVVSGTLVTAAGPHSGRRGHRALRGHHRGGAHPHRRHGGLRRRVPGAAGPAPGRAEPRAGRARDRRRACSASSSSRWPWARSSGAKGCPGASSSST